MNPEPLLELRGITKTFPGVVANDRVDFRVYPGEIHALLGENGAGKSTLMKIIYGVFLPDSGVVLVDGRETPFGSPKDSRRAGIGMVFQDFSLISKFTALENIALFLTGEGHLIRRDQLARRVSQLAGRYGLDLDPKRRVADLSLGERQRVEIAKLLMADARVLVLDEPTSALAQHEVDSLLGVFAALRDSNRSVVFITHKVHEALAVSDRITVLRRGQVVSTVPRCEANEERLVRMMVGDEIPRTTRGSSRSAEDSQEPVLEFRNVSTLAKDRLGLREVSLQVRAGEIVGVAGVAGNGQERLGEAVLGIERRIGGEILLGGRNTGPLSVQEVLDSGVGYIPEDALGLALVADLPVDENLLLGRPSSDRGLWLSASGVRRRADAIADSFPMVLPPSGSKVSHLSGGNVQRVLLARELSMECGVLVACHPTRGLDVLTAAATRRLLLERRAAGCGILVVTEDLEELLALSDRILVMYQGSVVSEFGPEPGSVREMGLLMTGAT